MPLDENLGNREWLLARLRAEIVGPDPAGPPDLPAGWAGGDFASWEEFRRPRRQAGGEEVLWQDPPTRRYGAGILFPAGSKETLSSNADVTGGGDLPVGTGNEAGVDDASIASIEKVQGGQGQLDEGDDQDVNLANSYRPCAMGLSFLADLEKAGNGFIVELVCAGRTGDVPVAKYKKVPVRVKGRDGEVSERGLWFRVPLLDAGRPPIVPITLPDLGDGDQIRRVSRQIAPGSDLQVVVVSRPWPRGGRQCRLVTVSLVNRCRQGNESVDACSVFQSGIRIKAEATNWIRPYPGSSDARGTPPDPLSDEQVNRLLYRSRQTFAVGHGCAADWQQSDTATGIGAIWTDALPAYETPSTTADLEWIGPNGEMQMLRASMRKLAGLDPVDDGMGELKKLADAYHEWIESLARVSVPADLANTAAGLVARCRACLERIRDGISLLEERTSEADHVRSAFRLANHAMLVAQLRTTRVVRDPKLVENGVQWSPAIDNPDPSRPDDKRGYWRPFQIAFLLMSLRGICRSDHPDRDVVDLIWFPTGGGKTEAYLGLTSFTIFFNRFANRPCGGADVIMRYTLRLLTAQQFQRAALLFCAMEWLRTKQIDRLGEESFTLGLWVGSSTTPNKRGDAINKLKALERDPTAENPFVLLKCPWCSAKLGPHDAHQGRRRRGGQQPQMPTVFGYRTEGTGSVRTVVYQCPDPACHFGPSPPMTGRRNPLLPVCVVDDDLVDRPPNLLIGTVDKFAMLAWKPELRSLFGIAADGQHHDEPPTLIIQDELHLISGPLGTMVGAYETVIDRLCRAHGTGKVGPKIVASTATISRASEQIRNLYARNNVMLFPPSGTDSSDSFFAKEACNADGSRKPGRLYVGVLAPAHGSAQTTQARVFATLLQWPGIAKWEDAARDPWWTLLCFFNSLRELGGAATLFVADVRDYLRVILTRAGESYGAIRKPFASELTSRIRSDEIPREIERLERPYKSGVPEADERAVDVCLASNIIEVGVDIPRLSLMAIVGQPKTTSQYIQVSSRIGRDPERPGLVVVLYGQSKPRDRSHYERFRSYHQELYAHVEPTSVTPFSLPAVERALHGVVVAAVRQLGDMAQGSPQRPDPYPLPDGAALRKLITEMVLERVGKVAPEARDDVLRVLDRRLSEWLSWNPGAYGGFGAVPDDPPLMHPAGTSANPAWNSRSWSTLSSLRNVDATCEADVTDWFNRVEGVEP